MSRRGSDNNYCVDYNYCVIYLISARNMVSVNEAIFNLCYVMLLFCFKCNFPVKKTQRQTDFVLLKAQNQYCECWSEMSK